MQHAYSSLPRRVCRPLAALGLLLASASAAQAQALTATFAPVVLYRSGGAVPTSVAVADVNGDGKPDLLTANSTGTVGVLLGNGNGTFQPATSYSAGTNPSSIMVADVNGDSYPDLLTANSSSTASVLLGNGNGTFQPATTLSTGPNNLSTTIAVADVNGDGYPDLLTISFGSNVAGVRLGNGNGTFQPITTFSTGGNASSIVVADVNGDGKPDAITTNGGAGVLLGNGNGTFQAVATYSAGSNFSRVAVADVNGDGYPDLLTVNFNSNSNTAGVLLGNGNGTFQPVATYSTGTNSLPTSIAVADVNGDGKLDLLTSNTNTNSVGVLLGNGNGTFQAVATYSAGMNSSPNGIAVADVNGDGKPDVLTAQPYNDAVGVLLNTTGLAQPTLTALTPASGPVGTQVTITGTNFTGATAVRFNGTAASSFVVTSATSLTAVVAAGTTTGLVTVTTPGGTATFNYSFVVRVPPTTVADIYTTPADVTLAGNVLANDIGTNPRAILLNRPANGSLVLNPNGSFRYVPNAGFTGTDTFTYYTCDPDMPLLCGNPATVTISVLRIAPVTVADSYTTPAGVTLTGNVLSNDLGTSPRAILIYRPANGTLVLNPNGSFTYVPNAGFTGTDTFTYYACDPNLPLLCGNPATVTITVTRVTVADSYTTPAGVALTGNVLTNDLGTNPRAILINRPTRGTLVLNPDGSFRYVPNAGFTGTDTFTYYACNMGTPLVCGDPATVTIVVTPATIATRVAAQSANATAATPANPNTPAAQSGGAAIALELTLAGYPNPFNNELQLSFALPLAQAYTLALYDAQGRLVRQLARGQAEAGQAQELAVPTQGYAAGLYLVRLSTDSGTRLLKLLKQ